MWVLLAVLAVLGLGEAERPKVSVVCSRNEMKVTVNLNDTDGHFGKEVSVYLDKLKDYPGCHPIMGVGQATFTLPLEEPDLYTCGTTRLHNKLTDTKVYYHRVIIEDSLRETREAAVVRCVMPASHQGQQYMPGRVKRQIHGDRAFENFTESSEELIDWSGNYTGQAPIPLLNIAVRQNGRLVDTALNVSPGTPLEMIIYLDETSAKVYGLLTTFLRVTDNTPRNQEEIIILNGCSIDPYIFANFESEDGGKSLSAKFRAFKFPESNYVLFVGTVSVCLNQCQGVQCGDGSIGYGRRRRSVPFTVPTDPNKIFEAELSAFIKVGYGRDLGPRALKMNLSNDTAEPLYDEASLETEQINAINLSPGEGIYNRQQRSQSIIETSATSSASPTATLRAWWSRLVVAHLISVLLIARL